MSHDGYAAEGMPFCDMATRSILPDGVLEY